MKSNNRFEFKYILDPVTEMRAKHIVSRFATVDPMARERGWYMVTSVYFDTPDLGDYYEKLGGFLERKKIRARIYEPGWTPGMPVWIEIKKKHDMAFQKSRVKISSDEWELIMQRDFTKLLTLPNRHPKDQAILEEFVWYMLQEGRRPLYFVRYKRYPFIVEDYEQNPIRITFDEEIETVRSHSLSPPLFTESVRIGPILEVKFNHQLPAWFGALTRSLHIQREAFSKYARSVDRVSHYNPLPR